MSRERREWEEAIVASQRNAQVVGQCMGDLLGNDTLIELSLKLGVMSQQLHRGQVVINTMDHLQVAAAHILCVAGHGSLHRRGEKYELSGTDLGRAAAKRVFHLK